MDLSRDDLTQHSMRRGKSRVVRLVLLTSRDTCSSQPQCLSVSVKGEWISAGMVSLNNQWEEVDLLWWGWCYWPPVTRVFHNNRANNMCEQHLLFSSLSYYSFTKERHSYSLNNKLLLDHVPYSLEVNLCFS